MSKEKIGRTSVVCVSVVAVLFSMIGRQSIHVTDSTTITNNVSSCYNMQESMEHEETTTSVTTTEVTTTKKMETTTSTTTTTTTTTATTTTTMVATTTTLMATLAPYATVATTTVSECEFVEAVEQIDFIPQLHEECIVEVDSVEYLEDFAEDGIEETESFEWNGPVLTKSGGIVPADETPSGLKETWYNLPMYGCLDLMGLSYDGYGVRENGVKTYNGYVMVASPNLEKWPKGTYIETTHGMGYVVDECPTGSLDIAVNW